MTNRGRKIARNRARANRIRRITSYDGACFASHMRLKCDGFTISFRFGPRNDRRIA